MLTLGLCLLPTFLYFPVSPLTTAIVVHGTVGDDGIYFREETPDKGILFLHSKGWRYGRALYRLSDGHWAIGSASENGEREALYRSMTSSAESIPTSGWVGGVWDGSEEGEGGGKPWPMFVTSVGRGFDRAALLGEEDVETEDGIVCTSKNGFRIYISMEKMRPIMLELTNLQYSIVSIGTSMYYYTACNCTVK